MPELVLTSLKFLFLAVLYLFVARAVRIIWLDLAGHRGGRSAVTAGVVRQAPPARASRGGGGKGGKPRAVVVTEEGGRPQTVPLGADPVTLGRADECTVTLGDTYVSQMHTKIYPKDGLWFVMDLGSTNGTYLNRVKVGDPLPLNPGDEVRLGRTVVEVRAK